MRLGLCTYNWGADWDLPTIIKNCQLTGFEGVELRTQHKHGVEPSLNSQERKDVARRFNDSGIELAGLGSICEYQSPDPGELKKQIEETKAFIMLCHDCGGTGVKVRPNSLPKDVSVDETTEQIGKALNEVAEFGQGYGVQIRLEVHGKGTNEVPICKKIMDVADHPNATICWNCNESDMNGAGLDANFKSLKDRLGTIHIHDLFTSYPWPRLFELLKGAKFDGWTLVEEGKTTSDPIRVMQYYRLLWQTMAT